VTAVPAQPAHYRPRHADLLAGDDCDPDAPGADTREHALALLAASPVYARVARLLGLDGASPLMAGRTDIATRLAQLPRGWHVVDVAWLDHLVIGPGGAFGVCVRHYPDAAVTVDGDVVKVNGQQQRCLTEVRRRAARVEKSLGGAVAVRPVLAVGGAQRGFAVRQQPPQVTVVNRKTVTPFLHDQPEVLDPESAARLAGTAKRVGRGR
jgi:hypothetical protein